MEQIVVSIQKTNKMLTPNLRRSIRSSKERRHNPKMNGFELLLKIYLRKPLYAIKIIGIYLL